MTARTLIHQHKHVYLRKPYDSFVTEHPQKLYIWLKPTEITSITITSKISTTTIKDYAIDITEVEEPYYDKHYAGTAFPATIKKKYQRVSFSYYFTGSDFAILTFTYSYSYICPAEIEAFIRKKLTENVSQAVIIELLEKLGFLNIDIQNWIDAIIAVATSIESLETTTFDWPIQQMVMPIWARTTT